MSVRYPVASAGFTIIEAAVALLLLGLLLGSVFVPLQTRLEQRNTDMTEQVLHRAREALLGYVVTHGYFPCPADGASRGNEAPGADHSTGACPSYYGFLPAATLGLTGLDHEGYALDGWGTTANRVRYAVSNHGPGGTANANAFTRVNGMRAAGIANLADPGLSLLHVCDSAVGVSAGVSCGTAGTLVSTTPVVVWAAGANAATGGRSAHEAQNPNPRGGSSDRIFVSRVRSSVAPNEFDDVVRWIPMPVLVQRMVAAGRLP